MKGNQVFRIECVIKILFSYFSTKTYVVDTKKEPSRDGSFEHPTQMFKQMDKKILTILHKNFLLLETVYIPDL